MADPSIVVDAFKFVAVRSVQIAGTDSTDKTQTQDERAGNPDGVKRLTDLHTQLGSPEAARRFYAAIDRGPLEPLAKAHQSMLDAYARLAADGTLKPTKALHEAGLDDPAIKAAPKVAETAWDALYAGYASGPDAGPLIDVPTAALQAIHFIAVSGDADLSHAPDALRVLGARPVLPRLMSSPHPTEPPAKERTPEAAPSAEHDRVRSLITELSTTTALLNTARTAPALGTPEVRSSTQPQADTTIIAGQTTRLTTAPRFVHAAASKIGPAEKAVLERLPIDEATSVPAAAAALQDHVSNLTDQLYSMRGSRELPMALRDLHLGFDVHNIVDVLGPLIPVPVDPTTSPDVDVSGKIKPLGIGDLKVVKQQLLAYEPGEVAHIENVLHGETKQRVFRTLDRVETTILESVQTTEESERDTQSTDRFELKKEAEQTIKEDMSVQAGVSVTGSYGPVSVTAHGDFAYSTSKSESTKSSTNFAREVVDRSVSKIQKQVKTERTTTTLHETEETDTHGLAAPDSNVVGVYRWVDKRYRAQVYNYGRRLMFEFMVPEPAAYFHASTTTPPPPPQDAIPPMPFQDTFGNPLTISSITPATYKIYAGRYNASGVTPPPPEYLYIGTAFEQNEIENGHTFSKSIKDIAIPDGYTLAYYDASVSAIWENYPQLSLQIDDDIYWILANTSARQAATWGLGYAFPSNETRDDARAVLPISIAGYDVNAVAVNVQAVCRLMPDAREKWQLQTFEKIATAYQALKTTYDEKVNQAAAQAMGVTIEGRNTAINLEIIARELKKLCLTMLTGHHWNEFHAMTNPSDPPTHLPEVDILEALAEGPLIQFFEQAFEWEQITYLLFPYFWGRKTKWVELSSRSDPDPLFTRFLQAGAARVLLPVSPAYNDAMLYFVQRISPNLNDRIWQGGTSPTIDDPLFRSIADEIHAQTDDLAGALPEGDPWEFTVPTTLVWLQPDGTLPTF